VWHSRGIRSEYGGKNQDPNRLSKKNPHAISSRINIVNVDDSIGEQRLTDYQTIQHHDAPKGVNFMEQDMDSSIQGAKAGTQYGKTVGGSTNDGTTIGN
jgi:hypothetical protein